MTCKEFIEFLLDYAEGELAKEQRQEFDAHIKICADCDAYLESYQQTVAMVKAVGADDNAELNADVPEGLIKAILAAQKK